MTRPARRRYGCKPAVLMLVALAAVAGCSPGATPETTSTAIRTRTVTGTRPPVPTFTAPAAATVAPLPPGRAAPNGEKDGKCPYLKAGLDQQPTSAPNVADLEGDRVYRTTVLTSYRPLGCRFYFYAPPYEAVADIRPTTFSTRTEAYNAMVRTAEAGTEQIAQPDFAKGVTGICFRTKFFGADASKDWAFVFAKGTVMVLVHTQRSDTSRNALYLARAIAAKF